MPHFLISIRNALLPIQPHVMPPDTAILPSQRAHVVTATTEPKAEVKDSTVHSDPEHQEEDVSETGSEADVESNEGSGVTGSWISVRDE